MKLIKNTKYFDTNLEEIRCKYILNILFAHFLLYEDFLRDMIDPSWHPPPQTSEFFTSFKRTRNLGDFCTKGPSYTNPTLVMRVKPACPLMRV
jgi:hypothetical protein